MNCKMCDILDKVLYVCVTFTLISQKLHPEKVQDYKNPSIYIYVLGTGLGLSNTGVTEYVAHKII